MKIINFACLPLVALLALSKPAESAAPGAPEGIALVCAASLEAVARQPNHFQAIRGANIGAIIRILELRSRSFSFGKDRARALGLINAAFVESLARVPNDPDVRTSLETVLEECELAVIEGRVEFL